MASLLRLQGLRLGARLVAPSHSHTVPSFVTSIHQPQKAWFAAAPMKKAHKKSIQAEFGIDVDAQTKDQEAVAPLTEEQIEQADVEEEVLTTAAFEGHSLIPSNEDISQEQLEADRKAAAEFFGDQTNAEGGMDVSELTERKMSREERAREKNPLAFEPTPRSIKLMSKQPKNKMLLNGRWSRQAGKLSASSLKRNKENKDSPYLVIEAIKALKAESADRAAKSTRPNKPDETVEIAVMTTLDPRKPNQAIRGAVNLPNTLGKQIRVLVFAEGRDAEAALEAGADHVGGPDLIERVQKGFLDFDTCISSPEMMPKVARVGRILGPRGLMPNPKTKTVTDDVGTAVASAKAGAIKFRTDIKGSIRVGLAKLSFNDDQIMENVKAFMTTLSSHKPAGAKGRFMTKVVMTSTQGGSYFIELSNADPTKARFMRLTK